MAKAKAPVKKKAAPEKAAPAKKAEPTFKTFMCMHECFFRDQLHKPSGRKAKWRRFPADVVIPKTKQGEPCFVEIHVGVPQTEALEVPKVPGGAYIRPEREIPVKIKKGKDGKIGYGEPVKIPAPIPR